MKRYEGMFLFDSAVTREWSVVDAEVRRLCERIGANLLVCVKFDERKLAYEIQRCKRGLYALTYFEAEPDKIADLERDVRLSEIVVRALVLRAENLTEEQLAKLQAHPAETPLTPLSGDGRGRHDDDEPRRGGRFGDRDRRERGPRDDEPRQDDDRPRREDDREPAPAAAPGDGPESPAPESSAN